METKVDEKELTRDELLDHAWDKLDAAERVADGKPDVVGLSDDSDPTDDDVLKPDTIVVPDDSAPLKKESEPVESADAKALKDTKAWATKLSQENAELRRLVEQGATKKEIVEQGKIVEQAKQGISDETLSTVYREYPELKSVIDPLLGTIKGLQAETDVIKKFREESAHEAATRQRKEAVDHFESTVMPKVMDEKNGGHSDFKEIIANPDYFEWADKQRPGLKTAALMSNDPEDIKWAISEYKKSLAGPEAAKMKQTEEEKRKQKLNNQMTLRGGSSAFSTGKAKTDPADYDAAWEQAEAEERRNR